VVGSRGSVVPFFLKMRETGRLPITDERMTRFWITLQQGVDFVLNRLEDMEGGEIFVPKIPSMRLTDLAKAIAPECKLVPVGIRPGEKLHEVMISADDSRSCVEFDDYFAILPVQLGMDIQDYRSRRGGRPCPDGFCYSSDSNTRWLTRAELRSMVGLAADHGTYGEAMAA
jgi:UDP-N-acetylglucosamine 4,6-dehydratase